MTFLKIFKPTEHEKSIRNIPSFKICPYLGRKNSKLVYIIKYFCDMKLFHKTFIGIDFIALAFLVIYNITLSSLLFF